MYIVRIVCILVVWLVYFYKNRKLIGVRLISVNGEWFLVYRFSQV